jgi:hypothetical protein
MTQYRETQTLGKEVAHLHENDQLANPARVPQARNVAAEEKGQTKASAH